MLWPIADCQSPARLPLRADLPAQMVANVPVHSDGVHEVMIIVDCYYSRGQHLRKNV